MIEVQKKITGYCETLSGKAAEASLPESIAEKITAIAHDARKQELVVPVVGGFSTGKSSMINSLLGEKILSVAVTAETSLATELHYSTEPCIEAVKSSGETDRYAIAEIPTVTANAAKYQYAKVFLNNSRLREIEPLVLVDMPGFDSTVNAHNKAIIEYLARGCFYIALSSVEEGTIVKTLERRLIEIEGWGKEFELFLSKANLRTKEDVDKLLAHYQNQLDSTFDSPAKVQPLDNNSGDKVLQCLKNIDTDRVFIKLYRDVMLDICNDIITAVNLQIKASQKDADSIRTAIKEMQDSIEKIRSKTVSEQDDMRRRYSGSLINDVIADVGRALDNSLDELTRVAASGNQGEIERTLNDIVRSALSVSVKEKLEGVSRDITIDISGALQGLNTAMKDLNLDDNFTKNIAGSVQTALTTLMQPGGKLALNMGFKAVAGAGLAASIINPLIGIIVMLLPEIIGMFTKLFGGGAQGNQSDAVRTKFAGEVFPAIKRQLRSEMPAHLDDQINMMIKTAGEQMEEKLKQQTETLNVEIEEKTKGIEEADAKKQRLEAIRSDVQTVTTEIMAWGK